MDQPRFDRRHLIGGIGAGAITLGVTGASGGASGSDEQNGGTFTAVEQGPAFSAMTSADHVVLHLGAIAFQPVSSADYEYIPPGGVRVTNVVNNSAFFNADLRLPAGSTIMSARVFLNPNNGTPRNCRITRYQPLTPAFETVANGNSTNGLGIEAFDLAISGGGTHVIDAEFNYRFDNLQLAANGAILYGAEVTYLPAAGGFTPFTGAPRVYDSRSTNDRLEPDAERTIDLGVPGTITAAVFNLTATQTAGGGFASCFRADVPWPGNSNINWTTAGTDIANLVVCEVDAAGSIKVRSGGSSTHIVVDMIGTFA